MENYKDSLAYQKAKKKAREIKGFYYNLTCYCIVIPTLITINLVFVPQFHWFWFSMVGWGTGLVFHGMSAFGYMPFLGKDWEEKKLKELMDKEARKHGTTKYE